MIGAAGENRDSCAEAAADQRDLFGLDFGPRRQIRKRVARVGDLIEADDSATLAFAVAATAKVDAQGDIAPPGQLLCHHHLAVAIFIAAEAVQDDERRPAECDGLAQQAQVLARWVEERRNEGVAFAVLGDFNRRMTNRDDFLDIVGRDEPLLRPTAGFSTPCWADARGGRPFIDHILLGGPAREWLVPNSLAVMVYAERDRRYRERLSDHCPTSVRLRLP